MARKSGALAYTTTPPPKPAVIDKGYTTIPPAKPKEIDKINPLSKPISKEILKTETKPFESKDNYIKRLASEELGDTEFLSDVMPKFISPIGILGMNPKYFRGDFQDDFESSTKNGRLTLGEYKPDRTMTVKDFANVTGDLDFTKEYRLVAENPSIEHESIHRGMDLIREYYREEDIVKRFGEDTANFIFNFDKNSNLHSEIITEINDARRLGQDDAESFMNRFFYTRNNPYIEFSDGRRISNQEEVKEYLLGEVDKVLKILPNIEKLAEERLYDRNPEGGPTEDARGLVPGSLEEQIYGGKRDFYDKYKKEKEGIGTIILNKLKDNFNKLVTRKPNFEKASKQMPKEFNKGGDTMEQQMELFGGMGGLKDDGMNRDPISGNEVPSGSMAGEVRDDIPAQLSDGEYVVPADVVRFFGVKFFEDLRMQAKMGLSQMERTGRIGGEPVAVEDDMLDPEDEQAIRIMMMGNEGGVVKAAEGFDFSKDAASKADPLKPFQSFVGSTYFDAPTTKEIIDGVKDGVVNYYHPDGRIQPVRYKDGKLVNPEDEQYTTGQWSTTPPTSEEKTQETRISTDRRDERESSNRERDTGGRDFQQPEMESAESTETLAKRIGGTALYSDAEKTKPLYMTESGYRNLSAEYDRLGLEKKGTSFAEYNNLPMMTKIQMSFGRDYSQSDIAKILDKANETPSILKFGLLGAILKPFIDKMGTADEEGMREFKKETPKGFDPYEFFNRDGEFNAQAYYNKIGQGTLLGTTRMDRVLLGIPSNVTPQQLARIEANRIRATDPQAAMKRMRDATRQFTYEGMLEKEERAGKGLTGDLDTVAENEAFEQRMKEARDAAGRQPTTQSGPNTGSDNEDGNQSGTGGQTSDFGASQYQNEFTGVSSPTVSQPTTNYGYTPTTRDPYEASQDMGAFFNKGGLASKPKAKAKRKKNTKGLGTKPKAT